MTAQEVSCVLSHPGCQAQGLTSQGACEFWLCRRGLWSKKRVYKHNRVCCGKEASLWCEQAVITPVGRTEGAHDCPSGRLVRVHNRASCSFYVPCVSLCSKPWFNTAILCFWCFDLVQFSKIPETNKQDTPPTPQKTNQKNPTKQKARVVSWLRFHRSSGK